MAWPVQARRGALAALCLMLVTGASLPAQAQLIHRDNSGNLLVNPLLCQTEYQVRQAIAAQGFTQISLNAPVESHIRVRATRGRTVYLIDYNYCEARIVGIAPLRPAR